MHEMSLADGVVRIIEETAAAQDFRRVRVVVLEIGALSAVQPDAMRFCFDVVARGTIAEGARLDIVETPGQGRCRDCGAHVAMAQQYGQCPACGGVRLEITAGDRMRVMDLAVE